MTSAKIHDDLREHPFSHGLDAVLLERIAGCCHRVEVEAESFLMRAGEPAKEFFLLLSGDVALEIRQPGRGALCVATLHGGQVLGWSWIVPPHRSLFDARALTPTAALVVDGEALRAFCEAVPSQGYALLLRVMGTMSERIRSARVQLADLYRAPHGGAP